MLMLYAFTLFLSATLLFLIQPMFAKIVLPLLGGTPAVLPRGIGRKTAPRDIPD